MLRTPLTWAGVDGLLVRLAAAKLHNLWFRCEDCGTAVAPIAVGESTQNFAIDGLGVVCPVCDGTMRNDGVFSVVDGVLQRIADANPTRGEVEALVAVLRDPRAKAGPAAVAPLVKEAAPRLAPFLESTWNGLADDWQNKLEKLLQLLPAAILVWEETKASNIASVCTLAVAAAIVLLTKKQRKNRAKRERRRRRRAKA